jgi:hypothetical protein
MTPPETLHTARLVLRKATREDAPLMFAAYGRDAEVAHYLTWRPHTCVADSEAVIGHFLIRGVTGASSTGYCSGTAAASSLVRPVSAERRTDSIVDMSSRGDIGATALWLKRSPLWSTGRLPSRLFSASARSVISTIGGQRAYSKELASRGRAFYAVGRFIRTLRQPLATATHIRKPATYK